MKENIVDIMHHLKIGQIIKFNDKEYTFVEAKRSRAVVYDRETKKEFLINGRVEVTEDIDTEMIDILEEQAVKEFVLERKIRRMEKGQCFIATDDNEYAYIKFNKTTFDCIKLSTKEKYRCKVNFVKTILDKIISQENL